MDLVLLRFILYQVHPMNRTCFNPYFNGSSTSTNIPPSSGNGIVRFNPYFNGSSTSTLTETVIDILQIVCFNPYFNGSSTSTNAIITVTAEDGKFQSLF